MTDDAELTGAPLFEIRTDVASAGVRICVVGGDAGIAEDARVRLIELAGRWSATAADSEIKRINDSRGVPVSVSPETVLLVGLALQAVRENRGVYDPRTSPGRIDPISAAVEDDPEAAWTEGFAVDPRFGTVAIPADTELDLRAVARGLAADLVVADMLDAGAYGVCVDVGGHVRAAGAAPSRAGWLLRLDHSPASTTVSDVRLRAGAVGMSARPAPEQRGIRQSADVVAVTVVAATAWQAAMIAQAAMRAGCPRGPTLVWRAGGAGLFCLADGTRQSTARWPDFAA